MAANRNQNKPTAAKIKRAIIDGFGKFGLTPAPQLIDEIAMRVLATFDVRQKKSSRAMREMELYASNCVSESSALKIA